MQNIAARTALRKVAENPKKQEAPKTPDKPKEVPEGTEEEIFGRKIGFFARLFGCRHSRMSRPVTTDNVTYRYCPACGSRRRYNMETCRWEGPFYYPASRKDVYHI